MVTYASNSILIPFLLVTLSTVACCSYGYHDEFIHKRYTDASDRRKLEQVFEFPPITAAGSPHEPVKSRQ